MLSREEIEKAKEDATELYNQLQPKPSISSNSIKTLLEYINQLEQENKTLKQCLIDSNTKDINEHLYL